MSRRIDTSQPLSQEDEGYLASRGVTPERAREIRAGEDRVAETVAHDHKVSASELAITEKRLMAAQLGVGVTGDPAAAAGRIRKARSVS